MSVHTLKSAIQLQQEQDRDLDELKEHIRAGVATWTDLPVIALRVRGSRHRDRRPYLHGPRRIQ
jgi:hypothetical protein